MLFRKYDGTLVEINKGDYKNDRLYYQQIMQVVVKARTIPIRSKTIQRF
jgi:hypothetical protein